MQNLSHNSINHNKIIPSATDERENSAISCQAGREPSERLSALGYDEDTSATTVPACIPLPRRTATNPVVSLGGSVHREYATDVRPRTEFNAVCIAHTPGQTSEHHKIHIALD